MRHAPIIALLTDFGLSDGYVASMKAVIAARAPQARIIDIAHTLPSQGVREASYILWSCHGYFPAGTIFVCVVDPGVGTDRAILGVRGGGQTFLAPDNGLLQYVLGSMAVRGRSVVKIVNSRYFLHPVSRTFHGRDIFAPVAARIASGSPLSVFGPAAGPVATRARRFQIVDLGKQDRCSGEVVHIDRFGNAVTDFRPEGPLPKSVSLRVGRHHVRGFHGSYGEGSSARPFLLIGSTGLIEVSLRNGSAAGKLHISPGDRLTLSSAG